MDGDVRKEANKIFKKQGIEFRLVTKVTGAKRQGREGVTLTVEPAKGGAAETIEADGVLVSIGRRPNTDGLGLDEIGLANQPARPDRDRPRLPHQGRRRLGDRRRHPRPDARAQGRGRRHRGRREYRRPDRHREPRRDPVGRLHHARNRRRRPDRGAGQGAWRGQGRQVPDARQQPRQDQPRARRLREGHRRRQDRPRARRMDDRVRRRHDDRAGGPGDGVRRDVTRTSPTPATPTRRTARRSRKRRWR